MLDALEAIANACAGLIVSVAAVHLFWPVFGWTIDAGQSLAVAVLFFVLSVVRAFAIRRLFRMFAHG